MQALKLPLTTIVLSLSVLQTMTFYLRTGCAVSQRGYGGTVNDPIFGLGQGNGMAPSVFSSVSSLMAESYKRLGHASTFTGAWSGFIFILSAILYVNDRRDLIYLWMNSLRKPTKQYSTGGRLYRPLVDISRRRHVFGTYWHGTGTKACLHYNRFTLC